MTGRLLLAFGAIVLTQCGFELAPDPTAEGVLPVCNDGLDNDGDGQIDYPFDPGCLTPDDPREDDPLVAPPCANGIDDDGDGRSDFDGNGDGVHDALDDPGCDSATDDDETNLELPECGDGLDNDGDHLVDLDDPDCTNRNDDSEAAG